MKPSKLLRGMGFALLSTALSACIGGEVQLQRLPSVDGTGAAGGGTAAFSAVPGGPRAARIIFRNSFPNGSFDTAPASGTTVTPGAGHRATRVFNPDGSLLAQGGPSASTWPAWLQGVEIGISGGDNSGAGNANCARFATATESTTATCDFTANGVADGATPCGAPAGLYRVSEFDCVTGSTTPGNGGPSDGVYVRAFFSRDPSRLAPQENLLAVLEYSASGLRRSSPDPTSCFTGGTFSPAQAGCSDFVWSVYLKHNPYEVVQPYLMLIPPSVGVADFSRGTAPTGVTTRQFIIPLAADAGLNTVQISRVWAMPLNTAVAPPITIGSDTFQQTFGSSSGLERSTCGNNSALCVGVVLHSLTFFRM